MPTIPDLYTTYQDGRLGAVAAALSNIEIKIGWAKGGVLGQIYTLSGSSGKADAGTIFKDGDMLRAIEQAFNAGSSKIYALRIGAAVKASLALMNTASPTPAVALTLAYFDAGTPGNSHYVTVDSSTVDSVVTLALTIEDRNVTPASSVTYTASGSAAAVVGNLADVINAGSLYTATEGVGSGVPLAEIVTAAPLTGGDDGDDLSNQDYIDGLDATIGKTDAAWIHAVGAQTNALWTAILSHCEAMVTTEQAERFAILETPVFESSNDVGSSGYLSDLQDWVDDVVDLLAVVGDRNAVVFAGHGYFLGSDGLEHLDPITATCGGVMAALGVQKSLINKRASTVLRLWPELPSAHIETLNAARCNCMRFKPGRGYVIEHSLTAAPVGSDFSRVNDLRSVYYGAKAAREAGQPYVGEENDSAGLGLRRLEAAMGRPLQAMVDSGQIDAFELEAVSTSANRLLGEVYVTLGIRPMRPMEMIYTTVFLTA